MVAAAPALSYSFRDYIEFEKHAHERHEYITGMILAMGGGTVAHSALCSAIILSLGSQLQGRPCRVFDSNARVRVLATGNAYYPDASVVCGTLSTDPEDSRSIVNPSVLVEVLSPTTQLYDRTDKLKDYQMIPSVQHIVHVAHDEHRIDIWSRTPSGEWGQRSFAATERGPLPAIGCTLDVSELFRDPLEQQG
jgi:Uma2 family endonuclease